MVIYNITIQVNRSIQHAWLQWMREVSVTDIMNTGCFVKHQLVRLLEIDETEGPTYALQLYAESRENYYRYVNDFLPGNERDSYKKWGNDILFFSTLMEIIN